MSSTCAVSGITPFHNLSGFPQRLLGRVDELQRVLAEARDRGFLRVDVDGPGWVVPSGCRHGQSPG